MRAIRFGMGFTSVEFMDESFTAVRLRYGKTRLQFLQYLLYKFVPNQKYRLRTSINRSATRKCKHSGHPVSVEGKYFIEAVLKGNNNRVFARCIKAVRHAESSEEALGFYHVYLKCEHAIPAEQANLAAIEYLTSAQENWGDILLRIDEENPLPKFDEGNPKGVIRRFDSNVPTAALIGDDSPF